MENRIDLFFLGLRKFLRSRKGETNVATPAAAGQSNPEGQQIEGEEGTEGTPPAIPATPVEEEKLYAGRFKTPEELETHYKLSSDEGIRLAQDNKRLQNEIREAKTPVEKKEAIDKVIDLTKHFDTDTSSLISGYVKQEISKANQSTREQTTLESQISNDWEETKKLYPDAANPQSKLYIRANEILMERGLAYHDKAGNLQLTTPFAYRMSVESAALELSKQAPPSANKGKVSAIAGKGSKSVSQGKLNWEQYNALTTEQQDVYDRSQSK